MSHTTASIAMSSMSHYCTPSSIGALDDAGENESPFPEYPQLTDIRPITTADTDMAATDICAPSRTSLGYTAASKDAFHSRTSSIDSLTSNDDDWAASHDRKTSMDSVRSFSSATSSDSASSASSAATSIASPSKKCDGPIAGSMISPPRPSLPAHSSLSLSQRRGNRQASPGLIDFSSLPRFPIEALIDEHEAKDARRTPQAQESDSVAMTSQNLHRLRASSDSFSSSTRTSASGSTPRAVPDRPGLFSRWSTDSEDVPARHANDDEDEQEDVDDIEIIQDESESFDGEEDSEWDSRCDKCMFEKLSLDTDVNIEEGDIADGAQDEEMQCDEQVQLRTARLPCSPYFFSDTMLSADSPMASPGLMPRRLAALNTAGFDSIPSPLPAFAAEEALPPAPKPHQYGFSPCVEMPPAGFEFPRAAAAAPQTTSPKRSGSLSLDTSQDALNGAYLNMSNGERKITNKRYRLCRRGHLVPVELDPVSAFSDDSSSSSSPLSLKLPEARLTRSQGLQIRDEGSRHMRGRMTRSLSAQLGAMSVNGTSSPIRTASALLDGTISPANETTNPFRVRLREMPGAITPDEFGAQNRDTYFTLQGSSSSSSSSSSSHPSTPNSPSPMPSSNSRPALGASSSMHRSRSAATSPKLSMLSPVLQVHASHNIRVSSPLNMSFFPGSGESESNGSSPRSPVSAGAASTSMGMTRSLSSASKLAITSNYKVNPYFA